MNVPKFEVSVIASSEFGSAASVSWPKYPKLEKIPCGSAAIVASVGAALSAKGAEAKENWDTLCAKCHGADANGRTHPPPRPSLRSSRIRHATDGDLAWMLRNGDPYQGMPQWSSLPEEQRWQIIAYLRTLPPQK